MIYLLLTNGDNEEIGAAFSAAVERDELVCRDIFGDVIVRYARSDVIAYSPTEPLQVPDTLGESRQLRARFESAPLAYSPGQLH